MNDTSDRENLPTAERDIIAYVGSVLADGSQKTVMLQDRDDMVDFLTPNEARALAAQLTQAADEIDPPVLPLAHLGPEGQPLTQAEADQITQGMFRGCCQTRYTEPHAVGCVHFSEVTRRWPCECKMVTLTEGRPVTTDGIVHGPHHCMTVADAKVQEMLHPTPLTLTQRVEALEARMTTVEALASRARAIAETASDWAPGR